MALLFSGGAWGFIHIADFAMQEDTHGIDRTLILSMRSPEDHSDPLGPEWVEELGRDFTALGGTGVNIEAALPLHPTWLK